MFDNTAITFLLGFTAAIIGCLLVTYHNIWSSNWTVFVTILGWLAVLKGVRYSRLMFSVRGLKVFPYLSIAMGLVFGYFGFVH